MACLLETGCVNLNYESRWQDATMTKDDAEEYELNVREAQRMAENSITEKDRLPGFG